MKDSAACRISGAQFLSNYKSPESERFVPFDVGGSLPAVLTCNYSQACNRPIGVGNGFRHPRPPNRACGSPAHGSPVGGFLIGIGSLTHRCNRVNNQMCREKALAICLLNAVSGAANMRSVHTEASIHVQSRPWISAPCLTLTGTPGATVCSRCGSHASTFLPPFPRRGFAFRPSRGSRRFGTMETLTSYAAHLQRRSPRLPRHTFLSFRLQPRGLPEHRLPPR